MGVMTEWHIFYNTRKFPISADICGSLEGALDMLPHAQLKNPGRLLHICPHKDRTHEWTRCRIIELVLSNPNISAADVAEFIWEMPFSILVCDHMRILERRGVLKRTKKVGNRWLWKVRSLKNAIFQ